MNTIKASEIKGNIPEGATHVGFKDGKILYESLGGYFTFFKDIDKGRYKFSFTYSSAWRDVKGNPFLTPVKIIYDTEFVPEVGMECEVDLSYWIDSDDFYLGEETRAYHGERVKVFSSFKSDGGGDLMYSVGNPQLGYTVFRSAALKPLESKEQLLREMIMDKWKGQCLEFAYDTEDSVAGVGDMLDFMVDYIGKHYDD